MEIFSEKTSFGRNLGPRNFFPSPQTRRQVSTTGRRVHVRDCTVAYYIIPVRHTCKYQLNEHVLSNIEQLGPKGLFSVVRKGPHILLIDNKRGNLASRILCMRPGVSVVYSRETINLMLWRTWVKNSKLTKEMTKTNANIFYGFMLWIYRPSTANNRRQLFLMDGLLFSGQKFTCSLSYISTWAVALHASDLALGNNC